MLAQTERRTFVLRACRGCCPTGPRTRCTCSSSRTSSATTPTPPRRSSCTARGPAWSASRAAACATIIEMVGHTRLDCTIGAAAGMRAAVVNAVHHARHRACVRQAADRSAVDAQRARRPVCRENEATTALAMRLARAYDEADADAASGADGTDAQLFKRLATAVGKYWACKRVPNHAFEALECLGGVGYVEESGMPRLYREAPLGLDLGGLGQRDEPRRAARADPYAALARGLLRGDRPRRRRRPAP